MVDIIGYGGNDTLHEVVVVIAHVVGYSWLGVDGLYLDRLLSGGGCAIQQGIKDSHICVSDPKG